jgi:hypothetical protein
MDIYRIDYQNLIYSDTILKSKYFEFRFRINGFGYVIDFNYNSHSYENNLINIGENGYKKLMKNFSLAQNVNPYFAQHQQAIDILKLAFNKELFCQKITAADEFKIHLLFIVFIFKLFDDIIENYGRNLIDYCLLIRKKFENDDAEDTLRFFLLHKLVHMIIHCKFEYKMQINEIDFESKPL